MAYLVSRPKASKTRSISLDIARDIKKRDAMNTIVSVANTNDNSEENKENWGDNMNIM